MLRESYKNTGLKHDDRSTEPQPETILRRGKNKKEEPYNKSTLLGFRHRIERYLHSPPYNKGLQLELSDARFLRSPMLDAHVINLRLSGKENVTHKPAIKEEQLHQHKASGVF